MAPAGRTCLKSTGVVRDSAKPDAITASAEQHALQDLPEESLVFLLGSRYCETDLLSNVAWSRFGQTPPGWSRVQAICDFVHNHIAFDYQQARATRTAWEAFNERVGVCRDYTHLAIAFCRCMNIPARYCTGYLGDMGTLAALRRTRFCRMDSKSILAAPGTHSIPEITCRELGECSSHGAATPPMWQSPLLLARILWRALLYGRTKSGEYASGLIQCDARPG